MTICSTKTEYVTLTIPYEEAEQIPNFKKWLYYTPSPEEEPIATRQEMAAIG